MNLAFYVWQFSRAKNAISYIKLSLWISADSLFKVEWQRVHVCNFEAGSI